MTKMKAYLNSEKREFQQLPISRELFAWFIAAKPYCEAPITVVGTNRICACCGESYIAPYTTTTRFIAREKAFRAAHAECQTEGR